MSGDAEYLWLVVDEVTIRCKSEAGALECAHNRAQAMPGRTSYVAQVVGGYRAFPIPDRQAVEGSD